MKFAAEILARPEASHQPLISLLANPDFALVLLLVGILLLYLEFNRPGTVLFAAMGTLSAMVGLYGLAQHPILHSAAAIAVGGLAIVLIGLYINRPNSFTLAGMLLLIQALPRLIPGNPRIHLTTAIFVSLIFSTVTNWLGRIALQARRNKRLPNPTPHSARLARIGTPRRVD